MLYLGSLQINTSLFEQKQRTLTTSGTCWQYPLRPEFLIDFLQLGQTDIQKDSSLPFNIKNNQINVYCFFYQVRQGMDEAGEGWGVLAAFPNRLSFPRQQRSLCSLGKKWGNREALRIFQSSVDKISLSCSRTELLIQISFPVIKNQHLLASSKYNIHTYEEPSEFSLPLT